MRRLKVKGRSACRPANVRSFRTIESVVESYIRNKRQGARDELRFYQHQPSLQNAIEVAALARTEAGTKHRHQARIPRSVLKKALDKLIARADALQACKNFATLIDETQVLISPIWGIGELAVYDIAHRIGAYLGMKPQEVYLHRGTRAGARALGLDGSRRSSIALHELPSAFRRLAPYEAEDCLC